MGSFTYRPPYCRGKSPRYPLDRKLGGPLIWSGHGGEEKNPSSCQEPNPSHPARSLVIAWAMKIIIIALSTMMAVFSREPPSNARAKWPKSELADNSHQTTAKVNSFVFVAWCLSSRTFLLNLAQNDHLASGSGSTYTYQLNLLSDFDETRYTPLISYEYCRVFHSL
jgi:hypothetical protein